MTCFLVDTGTAGYRVTRSIATMEGSEPCELVFEDCRVHKEAPVAVSCIKEAINKGIDLPLEAGLRLEADLSAPVATTEDSKEGPRAFVEKRAPVWKRR